MNAASLLNAVTKRSAIGLPRDALLADVPGWDSLQLVRLVLQLEGVLGRELTETELEGLERVGDVQRFLNGS